MEQLIELLTQIQDLAGAGIEALQSLGQGGEAGPPPPEGPGAGGGEAPPEAPTS